MSQAIRTDFVPKGDVCIYSPGGIVRSVGSAATAALRGALLVTAKGSATSGDTVVVGPGTYTLSTNLLKNGVNWHFMNGANVTFSKNTNGGLFDDTASWGANAAVTCTISGYGKFTRTCTNSLLTEANACVILDNSSSSVSITCSGIYETGGGSTANGCVRHNGGTLFIGCDEISSTNGNGIWWSDGELYVDCHRLIASRSPFYSTADPQAGSSNFPSVYSSGFAWIEAKQILKTGPGGDVSAVVTLWLEATTPIPKVWVYAEQIEDRGAAQSVNAAGGYLYVKSQKIFNTYASVSATAAAIGCSIDADLWVECDKIIGGVGGAIQHKSGKAVIRAGEIADDGSSTATLIESSSNDTGNAAVMDLSALKIVKTANGDAVKTNDASNTLNLLQGRISTLSGQNDLHNAAGTLNVAAGVEYDRAKTTGTLTFLGGNSTFRALTGVAAVTLTDGATPALDASLGKVFRLTAAGNRTIAVPSNPTDGQAIIIEHTASGGSRTLALNTGTGGFAYTADVPALSATSSGLTDRIGCIYNLAENKWRVVAYCRGA